MTLLANPSGPRVSVIVPAYNQGRYLGAAIESALSQTYRDFDVLVVDDGSTDNTPLVARQYGERVRYLRQDNQGLAGARNMGIHNTTSPYIALLDSDDEWLPTYLSTMIELADKNPHAAVYFCRARGMDASGNDLMQILGGPVGLPETTYLTLLRFDFLIPSTILMRRSAVIEAGLFDRSLRSCEDWDLWLRLSPKHNFIGSWDCLVRYRIHEESLSADLQGMHKAAQAVIHKHFGDDDRQLQLWSPEKRRAYGGLYRYQALTGVLRKNDWNACARYLAQALEVDPSLSEDQDLFFDLAMGSQPLGYRLTGSRLDLPSNASYLIRMLSEVFKTPRPETGDRLQRRTYGTAYLGLGLVAYNTGQTTLCRRFLMRAMVNRPELSYSRLVIGDLLKSFVGPSLIGKLKAYKSSFHLS